METEKRIALELFSTESYLVVNKTLLKQYGPNNAIFLSNLIDKFRYFSAKEMLKTDSNGDEWFYVTYKKQREQTGLSDDSIRSCIDTFEDEGVLETQIKGTPAKKWYSIKWHILIERLEVPITSYGETPEQAMEKPENKSPRNSIPILKDNRKGKQKKEDIFVGGTWWTKLPAPEKDELFFPLASHLSHTIKQYKNMHHKKTQLMKWAGEIRKLAEENHVHPKRIKKALEWYRENAGGEYIPVIESGYSLRQKFQRLEEAMKREKRPTNGRDKPTTAFRKTKHKFKDDGTI